MFFLHSVLLGRIDLLNTSLHTAHCPAMKYHFSLFAIAMSVALCDAVCHYENNEMGTFEDYSDDGCVDAYGGTHVYSSSWTANCEDCHCNESGHIFCCTMYAYPLEFDKELCEEIFLERACKYVVVRKDNRRIACDVQSYSG